MVRASRRRLRQEIIASYKLTVGCERCGYAEHSAALELHHPNNDGGGRNRTKVHDYSWVRILELDVLCANCHRIVGAIRGTPLGVHAESSTNGRR